MIHLETAEGKPHCVALRLGNDDSCRVYDGETCYIIPLNILKEYVLVATDAQLVVSFHVNIDSNGAPYEPRYNAASGVKTLDGLLDLAAGAGALERLPKKAPPKFGARTSAKKASTARTPKLRAPTCVKSKFGARTSAKKAPTGSTSKLRASTCVKPKLGVRTSTKKVSTGSTSKLRASTCVEHPPSASSSGGTHACVDTVSKTHSEVDTITDESEIQVHDALRKILQREHQEHVDDSRANHPRMQKSNCRCRVCPFRSFLDPADLKEHYERDHTAELSYVASGTKQLKVVMALYDNDQIRRRQPKRLLERSADLIRTTVRPGLGGDRTLIDRKIVLAFHSDGPIFLNEDTVAHSLNYRRVGSTYYSREFATLVVQETIVNQGLVKPMIHRLAMIFTQKGSTLSSLLLTDVAGWLKVLEDIMYSPFVADLQRDLLSECFQHEEFIHLSMDATVRLMRRVKGQEDYRCSYDRRNTAPIPDSEAKRRILTIMGRTGAVVGFVLVRNEGSEEIVRALSSKMTQMHMQQVRAVSLDECNAKLFQALLQILPNLEYMMLDTVHPAIVYEHCFYKKKTPGSKLLRVIMHKFNKLRANGSAPGWGRVFDGTDPPVLSTIESRARDQILLTNMSAGKARSVLKALNPETPWETTGAFIDALAALTATYPEEVKRRSHAGGVQIKRLLFNIAAPSRMQWFFNIMRFRHTLDESLIPLLGSGTGRNESAHMVLNRANRNQPEWHQTTAELQFHTAQIARNVAHNCAAYYPTLRQLTHATVLHRRIATIEYPPFEWEEFCKELCVSGRASISAAHLPLHKKRQTLSRHIKLHVLKRPAAKRPAANAKEKKTIHSKKRTVFTLKRIK